MILNPPPYESPRLRARALLLFILALAFAAGPTSPCGASEHLVLDVGGSFDARNWQQGVASGMYPVTIPARGWFQGVTVAAPALFSGPDGNNPNYHFSSQLTKVGEVRLGSFTTTDIEIAPITTKRDGLIPEGGSYFATVIGVQAISFTFGDFLYGEAQNFTSQGFFDPSPVADAGPNLTLESETTGTLKGGGSDVDSDALTYAWTRLFGPNLALSDPTAAQPEIHAPRVTLATTTRMQLIVSDAHSASIADTVDVLLYPLGGNIPPIVKARANPTTGSYTTTMGIDGSESSDIDGSVMFYSWTQIGGPRVDLSDPASAAPTFKQYEPAPNDQTYTFELIVSDGHDLSAFDTVSPLIEGYRNNPVPVGPRESMIFNGIGNVPEVTQISLDPPETLDFPDVSVPGPGRLRSEVLGTPALFNGPDGNQDGLADSAQANVTSLPGALSDDYVTIVSDEGTTLVNVSAIGVPSEGDPLPEVTYPLGFFRFTVQGLPVSGDVSVEIIVPEGIRINSWVKWGSTPQQLINKFYEFLSDGTIGYEFMENRLILRFKDGVFGDDDLRANGLVIDPGAPAFNPARNVVRGWGQYE